MIELSLEIKNYRCFGDSNPLRLKIKNGAIAFVGPNNSGKSAVLRFFYEFKNIWHLIVTQDGTASGSLFNLIRGNSVGINFTAVKDPQEVFSNFNTRNISISFESFENKKNNDILIKKGEIEINRSLQAKLKSLYCSDSIELVHAGRSEQESQQLLNRVNFKNLSAVFMSLANCLYIGAFRNAINSGSGSYFDLSIGTTFVHEWKEWKLGYNKAMGAAISRLENHIKDLFGFKSLQISSSSDGNSIVLIVDEENHRLDELGSGVAQFLIVLGNLAIKKPSLVLIDEPELNLHPAFQLKFLMAIQAYCKNGIFFTTHSMGLARTAADMIYSVKKQDKFSVATEFQADKGLLEFAGELSFSSWPEMGAAKILLCEGTSEIKVLQHFLRLAKKDKDVLLIPLGGSTLINSKSIAALNELKRLNTPISILIDSEKKNNLENIENERAEFIKICKSLGYDIHVLERRALENYLTDDAVKAIHGDKYRALNPFEKADEIPNFLGWPKSENWRIALRMKLEDFKGTDLEDYFRKI